MDLKILLESQGYLTKHKESVEKKQKWIAKEWQRISQSRIFHYEVLGKIIATILTEQEKNHIFMQPD